MLVYIEYCTTFCHFVDMCLLDLLFIRFHFYFLLVVFVFDFVFLKSLLPEFIVFGKAWYSLIVLKVPLNFNQSIIVLGRLCMCMLIIQCIN